MYRRINEFIEDWKFESELTIKIFKHLSDESIDCKNSSFGRTIGRLAEHIIASTSEMLERAGVVVPIFDDEENYPRTSKEILKGYEQVSNIIINQLPKEWNDDSIRRGL